MFYKYLEKVRQTKPLVHCITNYVSAHDCANILLACGASPIMADDLAEAAEISARCNALTLNIGTLNARTVESMLAAGQRAGELRHPILLDPVGAGASQYRTQTAERLIQTLPVTAIRGNVSEIWALAGLSNRTQGVDACPSEEITLSNWKQADAMAKQLAQKTGAIIAISGPLDLITDGKKTFYISNGCEEMTHYVGCGCMLSALSSAFLSVESSVESLAAAFTLMGIAGEIAKEKMIQTNGGSASLGKFIIDAVYNMNDETFHKNERVSPEKPLQNEAHKNNALKRTWQIRPYLSLYAVTDRSGLPSQQERPQDYITFCLSNEVEQAIEGGATCIQLREKYLEFNAFLEEAVTLKKICESHQIPLIINDNLEITLRSNADGIHIGQDDMPLKTVRRCLGQEKIIGVSVHTVEQAIQAEKDSADYLGVGAMFSTKTKPDALVVSFRTLKDICQAVSIPVVAIGGINSANLEQLKDSGIAGIAAVSAIFGQCNIKYETRKLLKQIQTVIIEN